MEMSLEPRKRLITRKPKTGRVEIISREGIREAEVVLYKPTSIDWTPVSSTNVSAIKYESPDCYVRFLNESEYIYYDVPWSVFVEFYYAHSKGRFVWLRLRGKYRYARLN